MELQYIKKTGTLAVLAEQCSVELWDFSRANENDEARMEAATMVSTACYEKDTGLNKKGLYDEFVKKCQTPLEFIRTALSSPPAFGIDKSYRNDMGMPIDEKVGGMESCQEKHREYLACFRLRIPLMTVGHMVRHRQFSFMQTSRRYTKVSLDDFYAPSFDTPAQMVRQKCHIAQSIAHYDAMLEQGIKPEMARLFLPAYSIMTTLWVMAEVKGLANFFNLRIHPHAQEQTKRVAKAMSTLIRMEQPKLHSNILDNIYEPLQGIKCP